MTLAAKRDKALLLVGFAAALRRSELAALDHKDVSWVDQGLVDQGLVVTIRRSNTDQAGAGRRVGIPYGSRLETCPVRAVDAWCQAADIRDGRLFRPINRGDNLSSPRLPRPSSAPWATSTGRSARSPPGTAGGRSTWLAPSRLQELRRPSQGALR